jgi:hypothetical protein
MKKIIFSGRFARENLTLPRREATPHCCGSAEKKKIALLVVVMVVVVVKDEMARTERVESSVRVREKEKSVRVRRRTREREREKKRMRKRIIFDGVHVSISLLIITCKPNESLGFGVHVSIGLLAIACVKKQLNQGGRRALENGRECVHQP